ncbi:tetratricopeptide repeat protein [Rhizobium rhizogenes]|uniref:tetratricopeptide repeat protein n=1 Tax=Rhizobium rhizogenes TaxID=359 RepID=UPI001E5BFFD9|nr:tetratricopeptide repeat protein [Rhizobium rhizogenes]
MPKPRMGKWPTTRATTAAPSPPGSLWRTRETAASQDNIGSLYALGKGVPQDYAQAIGWFAKAADQGLPKAQFHLGYAYLRGDGVTRDRNMAIAWFRKAAAQGYAPAQSILDQMN